MKPALPSNRSFGLTFAVVFTLVALFHPWAGVLAVITILVTLTRDRWLAPLNRAWMAFGAVLHRIVSPVVLGLIYFGVFTPVACVMRAAGRDALNRRFEKQKPTYWIDRDPPGPPDGSFSNLY